MRNIKPSDMDKILASKRTILDTNDDVNYDLDVKYNFTYIQKRIIKECAKEFAQEGYVVISRNSFYKYFMNFPELFDERNITQACNEAMKIYNKYIKK